MSSSFIASEINLDGNTYVCKLGLLFDCLSWNGLVLYLFTKNSDFYCAVSFYNAKVLDCIGAMICKKIFAWLVFVIFVVLFFSLGLTSLAVCFQLVCHNLLSKIFVVFFVVSSCCL